MYEASRQRLGITCERLALVETAFGSTAVTTLEAPDVAEALGHIIASNLSFDVWYRERLQELHGVNLAGYEQFSQRAPLPPNQELLFEWTLNSSVGG
jgi:phosphoserine phosphatase